MTPELKHVTGQSGLESEAAVARTDSREMLRAVRCALERGAAAELRVAAQKAKGASGIFGSTSALRLASDLMAAARDQRGAKANRITAVQSPGAGAS